MASILNKTQSTIIAQKSIVADSFVSRMAGLLNRSSLPAGEALIITRCRSIHMAFMRFAIDAIFVDKNGYVIGLCERIKPFRLSPIFFHSDFVIEVSEGVIGQTKTSIGDKIEVTNP